MASVFNRVQSARVVRCSVCLEEARNPTRLPCDHKYCQRCLREQFTKLASVNFSVDKVSIVCPYCRDYFLSSVEFLTDRNKVTKSPRSRSSVARRPLSARPVDDGKSQRCQPCKEGSQYETASFWCQNCSEFLCSTCAKYHKSMKMSKTHVVKTIKDKERYGQIQSKVAGDLLEYKPKPGVSNLFHQTAGFWCDPCGETRKRMEAKYWCETCKEKFCGDCYRCHKSMKMSRGHTIMSMKDVVSRSETKYSLDLECERHRGEILAMFCKRCQISCCSICAVTVHEKCGIALKSAMKNSGVAKALTSTITEKPTLHQSEKMTSKTVTIDEKKKVHADKTKTDNNESKKGYITKNRMENRKARINFGSVTPGDWVISMVVLNSGDFLFIELYQNELKRMTSSGQLVSTCTFYGDPWAVAVYNDSLAVVSFSDRKQLQLINITKYGLEAGKRINTRHKSLSVCFTKDLIVTSCWEGCIHIMNIVGNELSSIDKDHNGYKLFTNPEYIAADKRGTTVYVSDYKQNTVTALRLLPNRIDCKPAWVFKHTELEGPKGTAVDSNGVIYVSGMSSRNIFRLSPEGEVIQVYRRRDDRDNYEALALSPLGDKIYASAYEDDTIIVFTLTKL